jgi:hypothetical protein
MASITFTTDQLILDQLILAACTLYNYQPTIATPSGEFPNPISSGVFTQGVVVNFCKDIVKAYSIQRATEIAQQAASNKINQILNNADINIVVQ